MEEEWKPILGFEEYYNASDYGAIKSNDRKCKSKLGYYRTQKGRILAPKIDRYGYFTLTLYKDNKKHSRTVHRLVAQAFIPNPENKPEVNHIDGNKLNNKYSNLEWVTGKENQEHAWRIGLKDGVARRGEDSNLSKLKDSDIKYIRANYNKKTMNYKMLSNKFNISQSQISYIIRRITWKHIN